MRSNRKILETTVKTAAAVVLFVFAFFGSRDGIVPKLLHLRHTEVNPQPALLFMLNVVLLPLAIAFLLRLIQRWNSNVPALLGGFAVSLVAPLLDGVGVGWFTSSLLQAVPVIVGIAAAAWLGSWLASRVPIQRSSQ